LLGREEQTMKPTKEQSALLRRILEKVPKDACYSLSVVWISGNGWTEILASDQFIEDYTNICSLNCLEEIQRKHPDDLCWKVHSEEFEFGNPSVGSDSIPDHLLALVKEFGLEDFCKLPELRQTDRTSFEFDISDGIFDLRMTPDMPLTREHITIDPELLIEDDGIHAYIETWFDINGKFSVDMRYSSDKTLNFYAIYHPDNDTLRCIVIIRSDKESKEIEYQPMPEETVLIKAMMNETCLKVNGCDLRGLWIRKEISLRGNVRDLKGLKLRKHKTREEDK